MGDEAHYGAIKKIGANLCMYRCYEYGCLEPTTGLIDAIEQMRLRNVLWNNLVEIERTFKPRREELLRVPEQEDLERCLDDLFALRKKLSAAKKRSPRKRSDCNDDLIDLGIEIKNLEGRLHQMASVAGVIADGTLTEARARKAEIKTIRARVKEQRKVRGQEMREQLKGVEDERRAAVRSTRKDSGLYWVNHDEVVNNYEIARIRAMKEGAELRFHRWEGSGKITARYDRGGDGVLQLSVPWQTEWKERKERRHNCRVQATMRTTSSDKKLIAVEFPLFLHRPLPATAGMRTVSLVREKLEDRFRYKAVVSCELPEPKEKTGGVVTVTLEHIRPVATWAASDGRSGMLILPERLIGTFHKCEELQSLIDQKLNAAKAMLAAWLEAQKNIPDWLAKATQYLAQWRSPDNLRKLIDTWDRFKGDEAIVAGIEAWREKHLHLWRWKLNLEDQNVKSRREEYRKFAASLSSRYAALRISNEDLAFKKRRAEPEEMRKTVPAPVARTRDIAAHGSLRQIITNAFLREGGKIEELPRESAQSANRAV